MASQQAEVCWKKYAACSLCKQHGIDALVVVNRQKLSHTLLHLQTHICCQPFAPPACGQYTEVDVLLNQLNQNTTLVESLQVGLAWDSQIKKWAECEPPNGEGVGLIEIAQTVVHKTSKPWM